MTARLARPGHRARRLSGRSLALLIAVAVALPSLAALVGTTAASGPSSAPLSAAEANATTFAERAGFSPDELASVAGVAPATGSEALEVTFEPTNASFYDAPSAAAPAMTASEIGADYGLSPSAYASAVEYFTSAGLTVTHTWPDRLSLSLSGSIGAVDRAFATTLVSGTFEGRSVVAPITAPSLPAPLEGEVEAVAGLASGFDTFTLPEMPELSSASGVPEQNPDDLVTPDIARDIYAISGLYNLTASPTYATGKGIVLLLWGLGYAPSDISTFFQDDYPSSFPAPTVVPYPVDGAPAPSASAVNDPSNGSRELTLDIEWSGSMAPGATLDPIYAPMGPASDDYSPSDASMIDALNTAVDTASVPNVAAISMSFGSADGADPTLTSGFENDFAIAAKEKITVFAATGDLGGDAGSGCQGGAQPEYPAASPQVVAVGGTSVTLDRSVLGAITGFSESAWPQSGGGFSTQFTAPSWQEVGSAKAPIEANGHRGMPDVAATADYNYLYFDGQNAAGGGTSFATPLWAGMVTEMDALHGTNFGFLTPEIYALGANTSLVDYPFHDVTTGANCLGSAGPGWDTATGWGSPEAVDLFEHFVASFVNLTISAGPSPVAPGGSVTITAKLTNYTSGKPIAGVGVLVYLSSAGIGGPCSGTFGVATPLSNASGGVSVTISVPVCYLGASAVATATVTGGGYYANESAGVDVNLLGFVPALEWIAQYPGNVVFFVVLMAACIALGGWIGGRAPPPRVPPTPVAPAEPPPTPSPASPLPPPPPM